MKKAIAFLLILATLVFSCAACAKGSPAETDIPVGSETEGIPGTNTEAAETLPALEAANYDGYTFTVLWPYKYATGHFLHDEIFSEGVSGDIIGDAVYDRNVKVEEEYNVHIVTIQDSVSAIANRLTLAFNSGSYEYDAICTQILQIAPLATQGILLDYNDMPNYSAEQPWWNHDLMEQFSIAGHRYFGTGDIIISDDYYPFIVMANLGMINNNSLANPYGLVRDGTWTYDKMIEMAKNISTDNGDGQWTYEDTYGLLIVRSGSKGIFYGCGLNITAKDADGLPTLVMNGEQTEKVLEKILEVFYTGNMTYNATNDDKHMPGMDHAQTSEYMFTNNQALFQVCELISAERQRSSEVRFALLPMPKYDTTQENYICMLNDATLIGVPANATDPARTSLILSAMSKYSMDTLTPAFYDNTLTAKYMNDPDSVSTLTLVLSCVKAPDLGTIYDYGSLLTGFYDLVMKNSTDFASMYNTRSKIATAQIQKLRKSFE